MKLKGIIATILLVAAVTFLASALLLFNLPISGNGTVTVIGIEAYSDAQLTQKLTVIQWGPPTILFV